MSDRQIKIARVATTSDKVLDVHLLYIARKGYVLDVQPCTVSTDGRFESVTFTCFTNKSQLVEGAARFNAKTLAAVATSKNTREIADALVKAVCDRDGLVLA